MIPNPAMIIQPSEKSNILQDPKLNGNRENLSVNRNKKKEAIIPSMPKQLSEFLQSYNTQSKVKTFVNNFMEDPLLTSEKKNDEILHSVNRYKGMFEELKRQNVNKQIIKKPKAITSEEIKNKIIVQKYDEEVRMKNKKKVEMQKMHPKEITIKNNNRPKSVPKPPKIHKEGEGDNGKEILHLLGKIDEQSRSEDESIKKTMPINYLTKKKPTSKKEIKKESKQLNLKPVKEVSEEQKANIRAYMIEKHKRDMEKINQEKKLKINEQEKKESKLKQLDDQIQLQFKEKNKNESVKKEIHKSKRETKKAKSIDEKIDPVLINNLIEELNQIEPKEDFRIQAPKPIEKQLKTNNLQAMPYS